MFQWILHWGWNWLDFLSITGGCVSSLLFVKFWLNRKKDTIIWVLLLRGHDHNERVWFCCCSVGFEGLIRSIACWICWCKSAGSFSDFSPVERSWVRLGGVCFYTPPTAPSPPHCWSFVTGVGLVFVFGGKTREGAQWSVNTRVCACPRVRKCIRPCAGRRQRQLLSPPPPLILTHFPFPARRSLFNCRAAHWGHLLDWGPSPWRCWEAFRICCGLTNREIEVREWGQGVGHSEGHHNCVRRN